MLSPVRAVVNASADFNTPVQQSAVLRSSPTQPMSETDSADIARLSGARLNLLSLSGQLQIAQGSSVFAETIGAFLDLPRADNESLADYSARLQTAVQALSATDKATLEGLLSQLVKGISIRLLDQILTNPSGPDAARLALSMEAAQAAKGDLAAQAAVNSYQQNEQGQKPQQAANTSSAATAPSAGQAATGATTTSTAAASTQAAASSATTPAPANNTLQTVAGTPANIATSGLADARQTVATATSALIARASAFPTESASGAAGSAQQAGRQATGTMPAATNPVGAVPQSTATPAVQTAGNSTIAGNIAGSPLQQSSAGPPSGAAQPATAATGTPLTGSPLADAPLDGTTATGRAASMLGSAQPGSTTTAPGPVTPGVIALRSANEAVDMARTTMNQIAGLALTDMLADILERGAQTLMPAAALQAGLQAVLAGEGDRASLDALLKGLLGQPALPETAEANSANPTTAADQKTQLDQRPTGAINPAMQHAAGAEAGKPAQMLVQTAGQMSHPSAGQPGALADPAIAAALAAAATPLAREPLAIPFVPYPPARDEQKRERRRTMPVDAVDEDGGGDGGSEHGFGHPGDEDHRGEATGDHEPAADGPEKASGRADGQTNDLYWRLADWT